MVPSDGANRKRGPACHRHPLVRITPVIPVVWKLVRRILTALRPARHGASATTGSHRVELSELLPVYHQVVIDVQPRPSIHQPAHPAGVLRFASCRLARIQAAARLAGTPSLDRWPTLRAARLTHFQLLRVRRPVQKFYRSNHRPIGRLFFFFAHSSDTAQLAS